MTTGRINQVSHHFLEQNNNLLALAKRPAHKYCAPTARRRKKPFLTDETMFLFDNNFHAVHFAVLPMQCAKFQRNLHRTKAKNAEIRSKISKKVRYHLQSFELGPHRSNWRKKPPRTGRFFIIDANNNQKKNAVVVSMKKKTTGGQPQKKNHRRERRIRNPRTQTPIRCQRSHTEARRATPQKIQNPSERLRMNPGGSNRWRTIEF